MSLQVLLTSHSSLSILELVLILSGGLYFFHRYALFVYSLLQYGVSHAECRWSLSIYRTLPYYRVSASAGTNPVLGEVIPHPMLPVGTLFDSLLRLLIPCLP